MKIVSIECVHSFRNSVQGQQKLSIVNLWGGTTIQVSVLAYQLRRGEISPGMFSLHVCGQNGVQLWICESWWS